MSDGSSGRATRPARAAVLRMRVHDARPVGPGFMRVTLAADAADRDALEPMGFDQWFRMFLPEGGELVLPHGDMDGWYARWLAIPEEQRPAVRNYTVRELRAEGDRWMLDVDLVVHRGADGSVDGRAAAWALEARPGDEVGILDQGRIFQQPEAGRPIVIVADESGLPGVEGILRDLAPGHAVTACIEVPSTADVRPLPSACDVDVRWSVREHGARSRLPALVDGLELPADAVAYVVGEHAAVLAARARLRARGMHKDAIDFCAYWRVGRR